MLDRSPLLALAVIATSVGAVAGKVALAAPAPERPSATAADRTAAALDVTAHERAWEDETTQDFPADHWSQRDDFHGREYHHVVGMAKEKNLRIEDVLRAVDDDIHARPARTPEAPDLRDARAVPCKPRPFYD